MMCTIVLNENPVRPACHIAVDNAHHLGFAKIYRNEHELCALFHQVLHAPIPDTPVKKFIVNQSLPESSKPRLSWAVGGV